jgi:type IV secretory pathway TraG/TraD family ATPase VirD4
MIGSFLVTKFQIEAMSRADTPFHQRKPFYLYIDEFQNFATDSFENILSEARKYKLSLNMANQYISQIPENIKNAIFGNVGTIISF